MLTRAQQLAVDPAASGFEQVGWTVSLPAGFLSEWRVLIPGPSVVVTTNEWEALVFDERPRARCMASKLGGELAEVWDSSAERLICWGDHIPASRRGDQQ